MGDERLAAMVSWYCFAEPAQHVLSLSQHEFVFVTSMSLSEVDLKELIETAPA